MLFRWQQTARPEGGAGRLRGSARPFFCLFARIEQEPERLSRAHVWRMILGSVRAARIAGTSAANNAVTDNNASTTA